MQLVEVFENRPEKVLMLCKFLQVFREHNKKLEMDCVDEPKNSDVCVCLNKVKSSSKVGEDIQHRIPYTIWIAIFYCSLHSQAYFALTWIKARERAEKRLTAVTTDLP